MWYRAWPLVIYSRSNFKVKARFTTFHHNMQSIYLPCCHGNPGDPQCLILKNSPGIFPNFSNIKIDPCMGFGPYSPPLKSKMAYFPIYLHVKGFSRKVKFKAIKVIENPRWHTNFLSYSWRESLSLLNDALYSDPAWVWLNIQYIFKQSKALKLTAF